MGGAVDELADAGDIVVETVEMLFLDDVDGGDAHLLKLVGALFGNHRTTDDNVRVEGDNFLDIEVADAADALDGEHLGGIGAEIGASDEEVVATEGTDNLRDGRRGGDDTLRADGDVHRAVVVVGEGG